MLRKHSWRENLKDLVDLSEILIGAGDLNELYRQLTARIAQVTAARGCLIITYDPARRCFTGRKPWFGLRLKPGAPQVFPVTPENHKLWNFRKQGTLLTNDPSHDQRLGPGVVRGYGVRSLIVAPMIVRKELIGLIAILNKKQGKFTRYDSYLASMIAYQTGVILINARLIAQEKKRVEQIALLNEAAREIHSSFVFDDILDLAVKAVVKILGARETAIYTVTDDGGALQMRACAGAAMKQVREQGHIQSLHAGFAGHCFRTGEPLFSNDCTRHPLFLAHPLLASNSEAAVPVKRDGRVLAVLDVQSPEANAFSGSDLLILQIMADNLAVALTNAHSYQNERKHNDQTLLLSELISELASILDRELIMKTTVERIRQRFQYYFVAISRLDPEARMITDHVYLPRFEGVGRQVDGGTSIDEGLTGLAIRTGKTVMVNDTSKSPYYLDVLPEAKSELVVPIRIGDAVVGVLDLESDRLNAFDESDQLIMEILANALSTAVQNADSYQRLARMNTRLAEASRAKDEIMQIVAHDFRSPLTVIRGYMDHLLKKAEWKDSRQKEIMEAVAVQAQRLQRLAEATLKASRLDTGDVAFTFEKVDFHFFLQRLIFPWSEKHQFQITAPEHLPLIKADAGRLQEVMENLLSNAIKYSPNGGLIEIAARRARGQDLPPWLRTADPSLLLVSVSDEGIGVPADKEELLFRRFAKVHDDRPAEGIGLGLYIAKKMIEMHGGRIWHEKQQRGARFCFAIPALEESEGNENILVVDDDIHTLRVLHKAISRLGYDVITAADGNEALNKVQRFKPRLIILDVLMPILGGAEMIRRLREKPDTQALPVIVFTGKRDFQPPFDDIPVVSKNAGINALTSLIQKVLSQ